ncbi:MAG: endopeptidase La, partial [Gemmatimonadetes bacterium]
MSERLTLPVLPLREVVLFPGVSMPIGAGRPTTLRAVEAALKSDSRLIFAVAQRENVESVTPSVLYTTGTLAKITQIQRGLGGVQLLLHGEQRGTALHYNDNGRYLEAVVREVEDLAPLSLDDPAFVALHREARDRAAELGEKSGLPEDVVRQVLEGVTDPGRLADLVAGYLEIKPAERQGLLEMLSVEDRLRRVLVHVQRQIGVLNAQEHIKSQVQEELGERQREMFLREQMKAIRKELGEEDEATEAEQLRKRLEALDLPEAAKKEVARELERLERANRDSMEAQVIRTYLETVAELPWNKRAEESLDLKRAAEILEQDHYGLQDVKDQVLEFLAVRQLRQRSPQGVPRSKPDEEQTRGSILLFVGPPGVGKTSIAKSIARAMGRPYVRISLGGARDE